MATVIIEGETAKFTCDASEQRDLRKLREQAGDKFGTDDMTHDVLESLFNNTELFWLDARYTADMTSAPMFGILGESEEYEGEQQDCDGYFYWGSDERSKILWRWAFMNYMVRSILDDLADDGEAECVGGELMSDYPCERTEYEFGMNWPCDYDPEVEEVNDAV